jgi:hypothetical protein
MFQKIVLFLFLLTPLALFAQNKHAVSGTIKDAKNGEVLIGVSVYVPDLKTGTSTNAYGYYSLNLPKGKYQIIVSYVGYITKTIAVDLNAADVKLNLELAEDKRELKEVRITDNKPSASNVEANKMSVVKMDIRQVRKIPLLLGEVDVIKAVQLLPGVQAAGDGSSNLIVRGGNIDHNLVLLDEAVVYNPSHVLGFFSTFNGDAIKDFEIYKGGIPAQYGGRLASVLDVRMKDGNSKNYNVSGGIGLLSSRLTVEGPLVKDKSSFMISGRRSYFDLFFPFSKQLDGVSAYFNDLNFKVNYTLSDKDKLFLSAYYGRDKLGFGLLGFGWGNITTTARWNHVVNSKLFINTTVAFSRYDYNFDINFSDRFNFTRTNYINDLNAKVDAVYALSSKSSIKFGTKHNYYVFEPGTRKKITAESAITEAALPTKRAYGHDYYASHSHKFGSRLTTEYGARLSVFSNIGSGRSINYQGGTPTYVENKYIKQSPMDPVNPYTDYSTGEIYNTYYGFEPRLNLTYAINASSSVKASFNRMFQYMHLIQNVTASTGQEFWTPSDQYIKPQMSDQYAFGYFRNFKENTLEFSAEVYYKKMRNTVELRDGADIQFNEATEAQVVAGEGRAYGLELFLRKQRGKATGWFSYTLAKSERRADNINNGEWYSFRFDRTHYLTAVLNYEFTNRISAGASFVYATGEAFTLATGRTTFFGDDQPSVVYGARNSSRFPAYHRLDLSLTINQKKTEAKPLWIFKKRAYEGSWVFSLYNAYGRKNAYTLSYSNNEAGLPIVQKWYLFTFVPAITYNFKF